MIYTPQVANPLHPPLSLREWANYHIPEPDFLLGEWLTTTSRVMVNGPTGLGKTHLAQAIGMAVAAGKGFLHWKGRRPSKVLYLDGEMSSRLMKRRLLDASSREGIPLDATFHTINREFIDMPPLNTEEGKNWLGLFLDTYGPYDLLIFDNIQALLVGEMATEEQWSTMLPVTLGLTKKKVGQIWLHHTGHNEQHGYGSKTKEWQMDTVVLMKRIKEDRDLVFELEFTKNREKAPHNRADFEKVVVQLDQNHWDSRSSIERTSKTQGDLLRLLDRMVIEGVIGRCAKGMVPIEEWRTRGLELIQGKSDEARRKQLQRAREGLAKERKLVLIGDCVGRL